MRPLDLKCQQIRKGDIVLAKHTDNMFVAEVNDIMFSEGSLRLMLSIDNWHLSKKPKDVLVITKQVAHFKEEYPELQL